MRCHDPDACCAGQKACPTPKVCGCEPGIADLVAALNAGGVPTVGSCSGRGENPGWTGLADGRQLLISATADELKRRAQA